MTTPSHNHEPSWSFEQLEESLDGARQLTVSIVDRTARCGWEAMAGVAGIPKRRWRRHHPLAGGGPLIAIVDGRPAFDGAAWERFVSLVPGAVALPSRTAAAFDVARERLRPPDRAPSRVADLWRARHAARRLRRAERTLGAEVARAGTRVSAVCAAALAPGDSVPFAELRAYALAARLEQLLRCGSTWDTAALVDHAAASATGRLLHGIVAQGVPAGEALLTVAQLTTSGETKPPHLLELDAIARRDPSDQQPALDEWLTHHGWHAMRALHLEAAPLRHAPEALRSWLADASSTPIDTSPAERSSARVAPHSRLADLIDRVRVLTPLREQVGHHRIELHAALRALAWTLADRLVQDRHLSEREHAFDLTVDELLAVARGGSLPENLKDRATRSSATTDIAARDGSSDDVLRGIPASVGIADGPIVLLDAPDIDAPVTGAIIFCRITDPGWMPLLMHCAGLVTERGGPLSHAAIVARELGLPTVVGATGATLVAQTATHAIVDGATGVVSCRIDEA